MRSAQLLSVALVFLLLFQARQCFAPIGELCHGVVLAFGNIQALFRLDQVVGHEIDVAAHLGRQAVFAVMVAHHEHLVGRNACARQAIFVEAGMGFTA